jgi:hypothetical protein
MEITSELHDLATLPLGRDPGTHFVGWVGPIAGLGTLEVTKISCPYQESDHASQIFQPIASHYINQVIPGRATTGVHIECMSL